jgi:hypothetical protein
MVVCRRACGPFPRFSRQIRCATVLVLVAMILTTVGSGQIATEYQLKAAFLYNFTKFVEWPGDSFPTNNSPLRLCVLGNAPFSSELSQVTEGKIVGGHPVQVAALDNWHHARDCQLVFISSSELMPLRDILQGLRGTSALTVGDSKSFAQEGGMIGLFIEGERMRFEVNLRVANAAHLKISSKLLSLAKAVLT